MNEMNEIGQARRQLLMALSILAAPAVDVANLEARNVIYHADELLKALDAFYRAEDEPADAGTS
jgi:hypothetical protein